MSEQFNTVQAEEKANRFVKVATATGEWAWGWLKEHPVVLAVLFFVLGFLIG